MLHVCRRHLNIYAVQDSIYNQRQTHLFVCLYMNKYTGANFTCIFFLYFLVLPVCFLHLCKFTAKEKNINISMHVKRRYEGCHDEMCFIFINFYFVLFGK